MVTNSFKMRYIYEALKLQVESKSPHLYEENFFFSNTQRKYFLYLKKIIQCCS